MGQMTEVSQRKKCLSVLGDLHFDTLTYMLSRPMLFAFLFDDDASVQE